MSEEKQKSKQPVVPVRGDLNVITRVFWRSVFHSALVGSTLTAVWFFGSTGYFWPAWVWLGLALSAVLRAGDDGLCSRVARLQGWLSRVLGDFESKQVARLESWGEQLCAQSCPLSKKSEKKPSASKTEAPKKAISKPAKKKSAPKVSPKKPARRPKKEIS